ncbi:efflux RND transporter periplasmic adaptor subunit [Pinisolibacter aquiterrae]|uniref:efflux RND transporter periplasmic adaptor subunit n=1 Tax=Pinisolibacter aquiterrae TaxID=2815579 RepID=UPI001C3C5FB3|nr:efflux RND transporter periplasmic adaptor subunit [Pinisolibacter aquiterrae]MBV5266255.1 efflux RND transporter periplasmic adaptor subunit [Pinisolibacter aquiterrae]MCC8236343.1 efflux RND transporter periplasmic adaptor subunit [Pinisolibacter aquiterrae]
MKVHLPAGANRVVAVAVLAAMGAWIALGHFGTPGSRVPAARAAETVAPPLRRVGVIRAEAKAYARLLVVSGRTEANKTVSVTARGPGIVEDLPVAKGSEVPADTVIARLADEGRLAALKQAEALYAQRSAEWEAASRLSATGAGPRLNLVSSKAAVDAAAAALEMARVEVDKKRLATPIAGIVDQIPVERGQAVAEGRLIATVLALDPIVVAGEVSERAIGRVELGRPAEIRLVSGKTVSAKVSYVSRAAAEKTRTYRVEVEAANPGNAIAAGLTAEIVLPSDPLPAVRLPRSVLSLADDGAIGVRTVEAGDVVAFRKVEILDDTPDGLWLAGIADGARVIVAGQEFVQAGEKVAAENVE